MNWLPLFSNQDIATILIDSLNFLITQQRLDLYAYVIMENRIHLIASSENIAKEISNFKSFTARKSIDHYQEQQNQVILKQLAFYKLEHKKDREYQFWQEGVHPEQIRDEEMLRKKIDYIHYDPI